MPKPYAQLRAQMAPKAQRQAAAQARAAVAQDPTAFNPQDGWMPWGDAMVGASPYQYAQVELMRQEWTAPLRVDPWTLPPLMNTVDLYWRPLHEGDDA